MHCVKMNCPPCAFLSVRINLLIFSNHCFVGNIVNTFCVQNQIKQLLGYKFAKVEELLSKWPVQQPDPVEFNKAA